MAKAGRSGDALGLLRVEVLAARIEAFGRADPDAGNLWRSEMAVAEAVASVALEGRRVSEADLLPRVAGGAGRGDPVAGELALGLVRALKTPGDPVADPAAAVARLERLVGGRAGAGQAEPHPASRAAAEAFAVLRPDDPPILAALRVSAVYGVASERAHPVVERALFMAVEGALRRRAPGPGGAVAFEEDPMRGLSGRVDADWVATPALALSAGRYRPWSPGSAAGRADLLDGLGTVLGMEIGRIGRARDWLRRARACGEGRHGRSRLGDAAQAFVSAPCLTSGLLAERIGVTPRGATNLIDELVDLGLLREITRRRTARIWSVPGLAERLAARPRRPGRTAPAAPQDRAALGRAFADLDAALGRADALLGRPRRS
ncbi:helix-turn-helix domain-containing protein [Limimaricola hongkongensis]|uniref:HTH DNA binding domain-containing protein n=1 Tax=Limimaricola hongkongensis DSM 17492 TaxID=1122180 RepID=A0A017H9F3_9RHOB|nr:helix-turn-helix domain-containing protein [Limimaricola hongkongensis]EYD71107.1 hypothetical protein Lokhon_02754 [Limimaricola hongkongensis DSM 17492]